MSLKHHHGETHIFSNRGSGNVSLKCGVGEALTVDSPITFNSSIGGLPAFDPVITVPTYFQSTAEFNGNVQTDAQLTCNGDLVITQPLDITPDVELDGTLTCNGDLVLTQPLTITPATTFDGLVQTDDELQCNGDLTLTQPLVVDVNSTFNNPVIFNDIATFNGPTYMRYRPIYTDDEILIWLNFSSGGTLATDSSGNTNNGSLVGSPVPTYTALLDGRPDSVLFSNASGHQHIDMSGLGASITALDTLGITFEIYIDDTVATNEWVFSANANSTITYNLYYTGGNLRWDCADGTARFSNIYTLGAGNWVRVGCSTGPVGGSRLYINGDLHASDVNYSPSSMSSPLTNVTLGGRNSGAGAEWTFDGYIRNFKIWGREIDGGDR